MMLTVGIVVVVLYLLYRYGTSSFDYYTARGVATSRPLLPFIGNSYRLFYKRETPVETVKRLYDEFKNRKVSAFFQFKMATLVVRDPEVLKQIMVKNFDHFMNRTTVIDEEADPIYGKNLVSLKDQKWRDMRNILSPTFTSSKMKNMFHLIDECAEQLVSYVNNKIEHQVSEHHEDGDLIKLEFKDLFGRFANDIIATAAFGLKVDSMNDPDNEFFRMGKKITNFEGLTILIAVLHMLVPSITRFFDIPLFGREANSYFSRTVKTAIRERDEKKIVRQDLLHLMMQSRNGTVGENGEIKPGLTEDDMVSQVVIFFFAGFDTTSTFLGLAIHELGLNSDIQKRLQEEIDQVLKEDDGRLTYDGVMLKMKYLDCVCNEVLRKWPPSPFIDRKVSKKFKLENIEGVPEIYLERGDSIYIPVSALHHDPKYFPNPDKFDPERFNDSNKDKIVPYTFMPFGMGPRNCIGNRFALMEGKTCLAHILKNFNIEVIPETQIPLKLAFSAIQVKPEKGFYMGLRPRFTLGNK